MRFNSRAFTLVEIVVAMVIALSLITVVWGFYIGFFRLSDKGTASVSALSEMSIAFAWIRDDLSSAIIHEAVTDENGVLHEVDLKREISSDGNTQSFWFYKVYTVIESMAKPVSGVVRYELNAEENGNFTLERRLLSLNGSIVGRKVFLKGQIKGFSLKFFRLDNSGQTVEITDPAVSIIQGNLPDSITLEIEHKDASRINTAIAINSQYVSNEDLEDNLYYPNWLLRTIPYSGSSPPHDKDYPKIPMVNINGYGSAFTSWEEED